MIPTSIYVAGPMRGVPRFGFDAFREARQRLRIAGWQVICPAERDEAAGFNPDGLTGNEDLTALGFSIESALDQCFRDVLSVDAVALLPGWTLSTGARAEALVAQLTGRHLFAYFRHRPVPLKPLIDVTIPTRVEAIR